MTKNGKKKTLFRVTLFLILASALSLVWLKFGPESRKSNGRDDIEATGTIEATEVDIAAEIAGRVTLLSVDEGSRVRSGDLIAKLDTNQLEAEVLRAEAALASVRSTVNDLEAGARTQELEGARARMESAQAKLALDESDWRRAHDLYEQGVVSENQRDAARANRDVSRRQYEAATEELKLLEAGARPDRIEAARAQMKEAEAALRLARVRLDKASIYAPIAGAVLVKDVEEGEVVSPGLPIVTVADLSDMWVKIYIDEVNIGRIRLGQEAAVRVDAFPSREFAGHVIYISDEAEFTPKNIQTREDRVKLVFAVKVGIDNAGGLLKPGMYADIRIPAPLEPASAAPSPSGEGNSNGAND